MNLKQSISELERKFMPQIKGHELKDAISLLKANGIKSELIELDPNELRNSQSKVDKAKVLNIAKEIRQGKQMTPIIISEDNFIVDGHHRWVAYKLLKKPIKCIKIGLPQKEAIIEFKRIEGQLK